MNDGARRPSTSRLGVVTDDSPQSRRLLLALAFACVPLVFGVIFSLSGYTDPPPDPKTPDPPQQTEPEAEADAAPWPREDRARGGGRSPSPTSSTAYVNSRAMLALRVPEGWRRLDYEREGLASFAAPQGEGRLLVSWVEEPDGPLAHAEGLPEEFGNGVIVATSELTAEPFDVHGLPGIHRRRGYETGEALGLMAGVIVVVEEVLVPWQGGVLRANWLGYSGPPAGTWTAFLREGLERDPAKIAPAAAEAQPIERYSRDAWTERMIRSGKVWGTTYRNAALGVRFEVPAGLEKAPASSRFSGSSGEVFEVLALLEPMGQPLKGFLTRLRPEGAVGGEVETFEFAGRPGAMCSYTYSAEGVELVVNQFLVRDQDAIVGLLYNGLNSPQVQARFDALVKSFEFEGGREPTPAAKAK